MESKAVTPPIAHAAPKSTPSAFTTSAKITVVIGLLFALLAVIGYGADFLNDEQIGSILIFALLIELVAVAIVSCNRKKPLAPSQEEQALKIIKDKELSLVLNETSYPLNPEKTSFEKHLAQILNQITVSCTTNREILNALSNAFINVGFTAKGKKVEMAPFSINLPNATETDVFKFLDLCAQTLAPDLIQAIVNHKYA